MVKQQIVVQVVQICEYIGKELGKKISPQQQNLLINLQHFSFFSGFQFIQEHY